MFFGIKTEPLTDKLVELKEAVNQVLNATSNIERRLRAMSDQFSDSHIFLQALKDGDAKTIKKMLKQNPDYVNTPNKNFNAIFYVLQFINDTTSHKYDSLKAVHEGLNEASLKISINTQLEKDELRVRHADIGCTPITLLSKLKLGDNEYKKKLMQLLLDKGADLAYVNKENGKNILHDVDNAIIARFVMDKLKHQNKLGELLNQKDNTGDTPILSNINSGKAPVDFYEKEVGKGEIQTIYPNLAQTALFIEYGASTEGLEKYLKVNVNDIFGGGLRYTDKEIIDSSLNPAGWTNNKEAIQKLIDLLSQSFAVNIWIYYGYYPSIQLKTTLSKKNLESLYAKKRIPADSCDGIGRYYRGTYISSSLPDWVNILAKQQQELIKNAYEGKIK